MVEKKTSFLIKNIDRDFWKKIKIKAVENDMTIREFILSALHLKVEKTPKEGN